MRFSRYYALVIGLLVPVAETVRRWGTWQQFPPSLFDDYLLGVLLLYAAWAAGRDPWRGRLVLAAVWGFACGLGFASFFGQLRRIQLGEPDPAPIPSEWVAVIKGVALALGILALLLTLRGEPQARLSDASEGGRS